MYFFPILRESGEYVGRLHHHGLGQGPEFLAFDRDARAAVACGCRELGLVVYGGVADGLASVEGYVSVEVRALETQAVRPVDIIAVVVIPEMGFVCRRRAADDQPQRRILPAGGVSEGSLGIYGL